MGINSESKVIDRGRSHSVEHGTYLERVGRKKQPGEFKPPSSGAGEQLPQALVGQPVIWDRDWLPEGLWPDLDDLREQHHAHLDTIDESLRASSAIEQRFADEDRARAEALRAGEDSPPLTPSSDRQDERDMVAAAHQAALARFAEFVEAAKQTFDAKARNWKGTLASIKAQAEAEEAEADRILKAAERKVADAEAVEKWLNKLVNPPGGRFHAPAPASGARPLKRDRKEQAPAALAGAAD